MSRPWRLTVVLLCLAPASIVFGAAIGSAGFGLPAVWGVLTGTDPGTNAVLILELRLPRVLCAFAVGGLLALAGSLLQVLLRNPLADPYILGISGGAAVAALGGMLLGLGSNGITGGAFAGSLLSMLLVFGLSHSRGVWSQTRLLLTGVVVAAGWGALISFALALSADTTLAGMLYWLLGDLSHADRPVLGNVVLLTGLALSWPFARALNLYARGELVAASLGENIALLRAGIYFVASLLTAVAVSLAGSVGFVGLIIPHLTRLLGGADHRLLLPNAVLLGGSFLTVADSLARTLFAPTQLPVGVLTALLGVPVFLFLLTRTARTYA